MRELRIRQGCKTKRFVRKKSVVVNYALFRMDYSTVLRSSEEPLAFHNDAKTEMVRILATTPSESPTGIL